MTTKITGSNIANIDGVTIKDGGVTWNAVTVADGSTQLTAVAGNGYFLDTNAGVIEVFFPASPSRGDTIVLADYAGHFALNNVIVNTGTQNLDSTTTRQYKLATNDQTAEFVYVDSAKGWITRILQAAGTTPDGVFTSGIYDADKAYISATGGTITTSGDFKIHSFTGDGNFVVSSLGNTAGGGDYQNKVNYLVVAGGGAGGAGGCNGDAGGGGGAGGFREGRVLNPAYTASPLAAPAGGITVTATTFPITVGAGGAGVGAPNNGNDGSNSVFSTITSTGGGGGQGATPGGGRPGGSGGGQRGGGGTFTAGSGNTPPVSPPQGNNGGIGGAGGGPNPQAPDNAAGGGGGATQAGDPSGPGDDGGPGGTGATTNITGSPVAYAGGGGASGFPNGNGGTGGGGAGVALPSASTGTAGTANTGGGGGGGNTSGAGGKGIVIISYKFQN